MGQRRRRDRGGMERVLLLPAPLAAGLLAGFALYPSAARAEPNGSAGGAKSAPRVVAAQKHDLSPPSPAHPANPAARADTGAEPQSRPPRSRKSEAARRDTS